MQIPSEKVAQVLEQAIKKSVEFKFSDGNKQTAQDIQNQLDKANTERKELMRLKRARPLTLGESLRLSCLKLNIRQLDNLLLYKQAQEKQGVTGPVSIFNL